jgi:hypothetical protein
MHFLSFGALAAGKINGEVLLGSILKYMQSACIVKYHSYELPATKDQSTSVSTQNQATYEVIQTR